MPWTSCGCPWFLLSPEAMFQSLIDAPAGIQQHQEGSYFCHGIEELYFCDEIHDAIISHHWRNDLGSGSFGIISQHSNQNAQWKMGSESSYSATQSLLVSPQFRKLNASLSKSTPVRAKERASQSTEDQRLSAGIRWFYLCLS